LVGLFLGIVIVGSVVTVLMQPKQELLPPPPPPTPTPVPARSTQMEQELGRLRLTVEAADPQIKPFAPPPVDMEVEF
jgi:hypothetical protein